MVALLLRKKICKRGFKNAENKKKLKIKNSGEDSKRKKLELRLNRHNLLNFYFITSLLRRNISI